MNLPLNREHIPTAHITLTKSEARVYAQFQLTPTIKETAAALGLKPTTVGTVMQNVKDKLRAGAKSS